jgi:hypothetical protein
MRQIRVSGEFQIRDRHVATFRAYRTWNWNVVLFIFCCQVCISIQWLQKNMSHEMYHVSVIFEIILKNRFRDTDLMFEMILKIGLGILI